MLTRVTITGADDSTRPEEMLEMAQRFPFVEWGILVSQKPPRPRYPSEEWREALASLPGRMNLSLHVCGKLARDLINGTSQACVVWAAARNFNRLQINGYEPASENVLSSTIIQALPRVEVILQCRHEADVQIVCDDAAIIRERGGSASVLFDPSGGRGVDVFRWPATPFGARLGFAGGIGPLSVYDVVHEIGLRDAPFWIDMESRVRTNERLDLQKVESVLATCAPFVATAPVEAP